MGILVAIALAGVRMIRAAFLAVSCMALSACGAKWSIPNAKFYKFQNKDVRITAKVFLSSKAKVGGAGKDGEELELRLSTGEFGAVLTEAKTRVGATLEESGTKNIPELGTIAITEFRLGGTANTFQDLCAEIKMDNSNLEDWTRIGCVHFTDTPSESPTGGVEFLQ